ncbi:MAG: hypothetical protein KatS3mg054_0062 [Chloroflexus sp.]|nr:MAG: hypothetical protein KatS3mg054_0062 [Chloroflexus sp.]
MCVVMSWENIIVALIGSVLGGYGTYLVGIRRERRDDFRNLLDVYSKENERLRTENERLKKVNEELSRNVLRVELAIEELESNIELNSRLGETGPIPWCLKSTKGRILAVNEAYEKQILIPNGMTASDVVGKTSMEVWPKPIAEIKAYHDQIAMQQGKIDTVEILPDGKGRLKRWRVLKYANKTGGVVVGVVGICMPLLPQTYDIGDSVKAMENGMSVHKRVYNLTQRILKELGQQDEASGDEIISQ